MITYKAFISNSYATGEVHSSRYGGSAGGLVGFLDSYGIITNSFSAGNSFIKDGSQNMPWGLIGRLGYQARVINSYWVKQLNHQYAAENPLHGEGILLSTLQCATRDNITIENSTCLPALNDAGQPNSSILFKDWSQFGYYDKGIRVPYWNFGTNQQLPGLNLAGTIYRDSDGDGSLDEQDDWPNLAAVKLDSDGDGYPDSWNRGCDLDCQVATGLTIDQLPFSAEAWLDQDLDGKPDAWAASCDIDCQTAAIGKGLELDQNLNDFDNDGITQNNDPDQNGDGLIDQDSDHDGLIEIYTLEELDAVRHNLLGTGYTAVAGGETDSSGCPIQLIEGEYIQQCIGYELMNDLDFDTDQNGNLNTTDTYYNAGLGWQPIGGLNAASEFQGVFEGNNHTIRNLFIDRREVLNVGLFSHTYNAEIRNLSIDIERKIHGRSQAGALTGQSTASTFSNISSAGEVVSDTGNAGGLIGKAQAANQLSNCQTRGRVQGRESSGGLVGSIGNNASITLISESHSAATVHSSSAAGGLVGGIVSGENIIKKSYATGDVQGSYSGGLVGVLGSNNKVIASYSTGGVSGQNSGALIGWIGSNNSIQFSYAAGASDAPLIGTGSLESNTIENSYWATDLGYTNSAAVNADTNVIGLTLASLQCATSGSELAITNNCIFDNANEAVALPAGMAIYKDWELAGENNTAGDFEVYWSFGTNQQLPVLMSQDIVRRDTDGDGIFDQNDAYADIPLGGLLDTDHDGIPDVCNTACLHAGMIADTDVDGDGIENDQDAHPEVNTQDLLDTDQDGIPDTCNYHCEQRGLVADSDDDNDLIPDVIDAYPTQFEIAVDADGDGLADAWTEVCSVECQNTSGIVLDLYLNDFDNDGLIDGEGFDTDLTADNGLPTLNSVPVELSTMVDNDEGTLVNFVFDTVQVNALAASDVVDDALIFEAQFADQIVLIDPVSIDPQQIILPSGRQTIVWTAIDDAGNRSNSLQQNVNVYPRVRFSSTYAEVEENTTAQIDIELTAPAPFYPVSFQVNVDAEKTTAENSDFVASSQIDLQTTFVITMDSGAGEIENTKASLNLPVAQDGIEENNERVTLLLNVVSDDENNAQYFTKIVNSLTYTLDIKAENFDDDNDGILDVDDDFSLNFAASVDSDNDGQPDSWNIDCGPSCYSASGLTLDLDDDNDGIPDTEDHYPLNEAVALDADNDGLPDQWNPNCDLNCQVNSEFTLDQYPGDSDNDGVPDTEDRYPLNEAIALDYDNDGLPDQWTPNCNLNCQVNSGLTLDLDDDNDGILDVDDDFSLNFAASVDSDNDGQPDSWNLGCGLDCSTNSDLTLDMDDDNDGVSDTEDHYPLNEAVALDADNDGLPDQWNPNCNLSCQVNSGFTLDQHPGDSDNDGLINALDNEHGIDNGKPILLSVPRQMSSAVNSVDSLRAKFSMNSEQLQEFEANDVVDSSLYFRPYWKGSALTYDSGEFELPIGRQILQWIAIDDAGNRSDPMEQIVDVYPEVKFTDLYSVTGEGSTAQIPFELTGISPVYPVVVGLTLNTNNTSASGADIQAPVGDTNYVTKTHYVRIEAGQGNTPNVQGIFELPISSDGIDEDDEHLLINIVSIAGLELPTNFFGIVENQYQHVLTITDENLAPSVTVEVQQGGIFVNEIDVTKGEVMIRAVVNDPNGEDNHTQEWTLADFGMNMEILDTFVINPENLKLRNYEIVVRVSDTGNPVMTVEHTVTIPVINSEEAIDEEVSEPEESAGEENSENDGAPEAEVSTDGAINSNDEASDSKVSSSGKSGSGALGGGLFLLILMALYQRKRLSRLQ